MNSHLGPTILLCAAITIVVRVAPVMFLSRFELPRAIKDWLSFVPAAIMAALIATELLLEPGTSSVGPSIPWISALIATVAGVVTRSLFCTVIAGVLAYLTLQLLQSL